MPWRAQAERRLPLLPALGARSVIAAAAAAIAALSLLPLGFILWMVATSSRETIVTLVFRARVGELLVNTILLEVLAVPTAAALGIALAWLTERTDLPGARLWSGLAVAPLAVPAFVHSYAWVSLAPSFHGLFCAVLVSVIAYTPFLYLPVAAQLSRLDPALEDVAASLGHGPWRRFFRVVLPQLRLAILGGSLLVALHLLSEYGLYAMVRFDTFTTAIVDQFQAAYQASAGDMLGAVLVLACVALLALDAVVRGRETYARVGSGASAAAPKVKLGHLVGPALLVPLVAAVLSVGVPLVTIARWLVAGGAAAWDVAAIDDALGQTVVYAAVGAALTTALAFPAAWLSLRSPGVLQRLVERCHYVVGSLPGIIVALALATVGVGIALPLYQTSAMLLIAYALLFLPRAVVGLRASLAQIPVTLEQAAMSLGKSPRQALLQVTLRLGAPGVGAAFGLVALGIANELTATLLLAPTGTRMLATAFWTRINDLDYASAAPYALLMVIISLPLTALVHAQAQRIAGR